MNAFQTQLLNAAQKGHAAFEAGKPCEPPYKFTPQAKGLWRQRCTHWKGGWKEAEEKAKRKQFLTQTTAIPPGQTP